jgi:hypothetical protein
VNEFLRGQPAFKLEHARQLLPFNEGVDGAYVARLTSGGPTKPSCQIDPSGKA